MSPYVRTVRTASGARAVQIVHSTRAGKRDTEHVGSAHDERQLELLKAAARQRIHAGQGELDLGLAVAGAAGQHAPITATRLEHLLGAIGSAYRALRFDVCADGDDVFEMLVAARVIEPTSKLDSLRVITETGLAAPSYATVKRRLPRYATEPFREAIAAMCAAHVAIGPATLLLYDVTTLYFETDEGDGFREPGFSKERRLEPQIVVGLLTDAAGFPLMVNAFEGNKAETLTMIPVIEAFMAAHRLDDVTIVADAGMISEASRKSIEDAGLSFILGAKIPTVPHVVAAWREAHPGANIPDGHVFTQPWPAGPTDKRRDQMIYYQYRADRARRTLHGIDQQIAKAQAAIAGKAAIKRNRFVTLTGGQRSINRDLEAKARALAGIKGYVTNLPGTTADQVIDAYHQLWNVEKSFRMSKSDLAARPIYHHKRESIDAHLTIVFTALAVARWIENQTGWSIRRFVKTTRRYRTIDIRASGRTITASDPLPDDVADALRAIREHTK